MPMKPAELWRTSAACKGFDVRLFYAELDGGTEVARRICLSCEVKGECLEWALDNREMTEGVWGGLSPLQRRSEARRRRREGRKL